MLGNKLETKKLFIENIPIIEIYLQNLADKPAPLLVFYHGWTSDKINGSGFGETIAKFGFRVVVPDCAYHGERANQLIRMWDVHYLFNSVIETAAEFPRIVDYYKKQNLIAEDFYAVAGVSMGGMIANILLKREPAIKAAGILMGSPQLQKFAEWIVYQGLEDLFRVSNDFYPDLTLPDERIQMGIINRETDLILELVPRLENWDLSQSPQAIAGRPVFYWHAKPDSIMPYSFTAEFINSIRDLPEAEFVYFKSDQQGGHMVPLIETRRLALFLQNCYEVLALDLADFSKAEIWSVTNNQIKEFLRNN
ncbi:MAG: alpha/beta fold hydrolase [Saccharofermentanales bacterium]